MSIISVRSIHIAMALVFFVLGYLYQEYRHTFSFVFSQNVPNCYAVFITSALVGAVYNRHQIKNVVGVTVGVIGYEVIQLWLPERTFDLWDIAGSIIGMLGYLALARVIYR